MWRRANRSRSPRVDNSVLPAGPWDRGVHGSTGTGPLGVGRCPTARGSATGLLVKVVWCIASGTSSWARIASSQVRPVSVSSTRPSRHQPALL
jgi:hypothetical protein